MLDKNKVLQLLLRKRQIEGDHWLYIGVDNKLMINYKIYAVPRLSLFVWKNFDLTSTLLACHIPECKHKNCFSPEHLYAGTAKDNAKDKIVAGTSTNWHCLMKTHCPQGHEYSPENTRVYKGRRFCRECQRERDKWNKSLSFRTLNSFLRQK